METLTSRQAQQLRWIETQKPHAGSWIDRPGYFMLRAGRRSISISEADWAAIRPYLALNPAPQVLFGLSETGMAATATTV